MRLNPQAASGTGAKVEKGSAGTAAARTRLKGIVRTLLLGNGVSHARLKST